MANEFVARNGLISQNNVIVSGSVNITGASGTLFTSNTDTLEITGSLNVTGSATFTGSVNFASGLTGSLIGTASYASNANLLDGLDSSVFTLTSSFQNYTSSTDAKIASINTTTASLNASITALNAQSASLLSYTSSTDAKIASIYTTTSSLNASVASLNSYTSSTDAKIASIYSTTASLNASVAGLNSYTASLNNKTSSFATTGSNTFTSTQTITGSLNVSGNITTPGSITAQTLIVQTITSSIDFVTGSTRFGSLLTNTHVFSGSVTMNPGGLFVSSSGLVGIGTTSPNAKLHVYDAANTFSGIFGSGGGAQLVALGNGTGIAQIQAFSNNAFAAYSNIAINAGGGNVGIGITNPTSLLHVSGTTGGVFEVDGAAAVNALYVSASGNVGIGNTSPTSKLQIGDTVTGPNGIATLTLTGANTAPQIATKPGLYHRHNVGLGVFSDYAISFQVNGSTSLTDAMYINNTGSVGIGTTSPTAKLTVLGSNTIGGSIPTSWAAIASGRLGIVNGNNSLYFDNNGTIAEISTYNYSTTATLPLILQANGGNVGIGTTSPNHILTANNSASGGTYLGLYQSYVDGNDWRNWTIGTNNQSFGDFAIAQSNATGGNPLSAGTIRMYISKAGNVGIGTTTTSGARLDVVSGAGANTYFNSTGSGIYLQIANNGTNLGYIGDGTTLISGGSATDFVVRSQTALAFATNGNTERARITSAGDVGIGITSPTDKLDVVGNVVFGSSTEKISMGSNSLAFNRKVATGAIYSSSGYAYQFQHTPSVTQTSDYLAMQVYNTAGTQVTSAALTINGLGYVGINTISPAYNLDVNGTSRFTGNIWAQADLRFGTDLAGANTSIIKWQGSGAVIPNSLGIFTWSDAKDIQIGGNNVYFKSESGSTRLTIASTGALSGSSATFSSTVTAASFVETSAQRYKENVQTLSSADADNLLKLRPVTFDWIESQQSDIGFIAEEVSEHLPLLVNSNDNGEIEGVKYSKLTALLTKIVQDHELQIQALKQEIEQLKNK